ncbi:MAG: hypothetical protein LC730_06445, partial [Acidobacteria bacterium]|nr:hypothetical protein [Acidobacteriota bacterium]
MDFLRYFRQQVTLASVLGVPVRADFRWFLVFAIVSALIAGSIRPQVGDLGLSFVFGFATAVVFFISIFLHEFAHAVVAKLEKLEV